jgi:hypothetical protein
MSESQKMLQRFDRLLKAMASGEPHKRKDSLEAPKNQKGEPKLP